MKRSSKGNSRNEQSSAKLLDEEWSLHDWNLVEVLRSRNLATPKSFAEASLVAKERYKARDLLSSLKIPAMSLSTIVTPKRLSLPRSLSQDTEESYSPCNVLATTPDCSFSSQGSIMGHIGSPVESQVSRQVLELTLGDARDCSQDSFSSDPATDHNKGALAFLDLVEKAYKERKDTEVAVSIEQLLISMMDLGVSHRLPTASDLPDVLNRNGWDVRQVSQVWSVGPVQNYSDVWDTAALEALGGRGIMGRVWHSLKDQDLTGHGKRGAEDDMSQSHSKRTRKDRLLQRTKAVKVLYKSYNWSRQCLLSMLLLL